MDHETLSSLVLGPRGQALITGDDAYDEARSIWNGTIDKRPAVIVRCGGVADVIAAVNFARDQGLPVAVRGGGHHVAGGSLIDDGVVIDLSLMRAVRVDPSAATVSCEGGALIGDVDHETQVFALAVPFGLVSKTGIAGLTLGGGLGWLRRKHGFSSDALIGADVVTADGKLVHASATESPELFWALRGGGWDMGVVTSFEFQAYPVGPEVYVSFCTYPIAEAHQVLSRLAQYGRTAPDSVSPVAVIWTFPDEGEAFPPEVQGLEFVGVLAPYIGDIEEGRRVTQPLRELGTPLLDMSDVMPFELGVQRLFDEDYPDGQRYYWKSIYLRQLNSDAIDAIIAMGARRPTPITSLDIWMLGGAIARPIDTPTGHRDAAYLIGIEANWVDSDLDERAIQWTRDVYEALTRFSTGGSYLNFEDPDDAVATAASHGDANLARLLAVKRYYDPANLFRSRRGLG